MSQSSPSTNGSRSPLLSDSVYNVLKHVAASGLPALAALYFALSQIWHFPDTAQVMASIAAINTCLGVLLGVSTVVYNNSDAKYVGTIEVTNSSDGQKKTFSLNLNQDPESIENLDEATFKVAPVVLAPSVVPTPPEVPPMQTVYPNPGNPPQLGGPRH